MDIQKDLEKSAADAAVGHVFCFQKAGKLAKGVKCVLMMPDAV